MNTNELIPFNWDEYQKGGWEAVVYSRVVTESNSVKMPSMQYHLPEVVE